MLEELKFVMRGVARRDYVPGLTHFRIKDGVCVGHNGTVALAAPVDIGFDVAPYAFGFIKALQSCEDVISLRMEGKDLLVRSGDFRVLVPCLPLEDVPLMAPEGRMFRPVASLLNCFQNLNPFIGIDASRPWALGILFANNSAYATNNVVIAEYWLGEPFPDVVNIPSAIVEEVLRLGEEMEGIQIDKGSVTFHYSGKRWVKSALLSLDWPNVPGAMAGAWTEAQLSVIPPGMAKAVEKLRPFATPKAEYIYFRGTDIATTKDGINSGGAVWEMDAPARGCYHVDHLTTVLAVATHIDFTRYPKPIPFAGGNLRGALLGISDAK